MGTAERDRQDERARVSAIQQGVTRGILRAGCIVVIAVLLAMVAIASVASSGSKYRHPLLPWTWSKPEFNGKN